MRKVILFLILTCGLSLFMTACDKEGQKEDYIGYYTTSTNEELILKTNYEFVLVLNNVIHSYGEYDIRGKYFSFRDATKYHSFVGYLDLEHEIKITITISIVTYSFTYSPFQDKSNTVRFNTFDGEYIEPIIVKHGYKIPEQPPLYRENEEFLGWSTSADQSKKYYFSTPVVGDITLYPVWDTKRFFISFDTGFSHEIECLVVNAGSKIEPPNMPLRDEYILSGWYTSANLDVEYDFTKPISSSFTLYAKWETKTHTVSYQTNCPIELGEQRISHGELLSPPNEISWHPHVFVGWYIDEEFEEIYSFSTPISDDLTLYAKWEIAVHTVTFVTNSTDEIAAKSVPHGNLLTYVDLPSTPELVFEGWFTEPSFDNKYSFLTPVTSNLILYAKWNVPDVLVTFNDGQSSTSLYYKIGSEINPLEVSKEGYVFEGWFTDLDFINEFDFKTLVTQNITLYAKWSSTMASYEISFVVDSAVIATETVQEGFNAKKPIVAPRLGFGLIGWYSNSAYTELFEFHASVTQDTTLYGFYVPCTELIEYQMNNTLGGYAASLKYTYLLTLVSLYIPDFHNEVPVVSFTSNAIGLAENLTSLRLPSGLLDIDVASINAPSLAHIDIFNSSHYKSINGVLFSIDEKILICYPRGNTNADYVIPNNVQIIANYAFYNNEYLISVTLNSACKNLSGQSFINLPNLKHFTAINNEKYTSVDGVLYTKDSSVLIKYPDGRSDKTYTVLRDCQEIGEYAFYQNRVLKDVILPNVTHIGEYGFSYSFIRTLDGLLISRIDSHAFAFAEHIKEVHLPNLEAIAENAFKGCISLEVAFLPLVELISYGAFLNCISLQEINISAASIIADFAFFGCQSLLEMHFPGSLVSIGDQSFASCINISTISFNERLREIGVAAFKNLTSLLAISLPEGLTTLGAEAFNDCRNLASVIFSELLTVIEDYSFHQTALTSLTLPSHLTTIGEYAFADTLITSLVVPMDTTYIGAGAFGNCVYLIDVIIENKSNSEYTELGNDVFGGCVNIERIVLGDESLYENYINLEGWIDYIDILTYVGYEPPVEEPITEE